MLSESALRARAHCRGFRIEKSRQAQHINNRGLYQLIDDRNCVVLGVDYDAPLADIEEFLADIDKANSAA